MITYGVIYLNCMGTPLKYSFINEHRTVWDVMTMFRALCVARAGFYACLNNLVSAREKANQRLTIVWIHSPCALSRDS